MRTKSFFKKQGITAVETIIGVSLAALILAFAGQAIVQFVNTARVVSEKTKALYLAEEGHELMRFIRDESWANVGGLTNGSTYYFAVSGTSIGVTTTPQLIDGYRRTVVLQNVYRDTTTQDIVASTTGGSVADTSTKYVRVDVSWGTPTSTVSLTSMLTEIDP